MKLKLCGYPGCNKLAVIHPYYCPEHQLLAEQKRKENAFKNATRYADYSNPEWRKLRAKVLAEHNYCAKFDESNLIVLCESCHAIETQREIESRKA